MKSGENLITVGLSEFYERKAKMSTKKDAKKKNTKDLPPLWEYQLFADTLKAEMELLKNFRHDVAHGISFEPAQTLIDYREVIEWARIRTAELQNCVKVIDELMNKAIQQAIGEPGQAGDADYIVYVAERIVEMFIIVGKLTLDFKTAMVPVDCAVLVENLSLMSASVAEDIQNFVDHYCKTIDRIMQGKETGKIIISLDMREPKTDIVHRELEKIEKRIKDEEKESTEALIQILRESSSPRDAKK